MAIQPKPKLNTMPSIKNNEIDNFINRAPDSGVSHEQLIPKKTKRKKQITITMDDELIEKIDIAASENGQSRAAFINMSCINALKNGMNIKGINDN
ncbi:TPA: CopG family transcriptional regulator [Vibrio vulnificus]|nr:CopG family transcriptional regulator [Vibrio vulnificus]